MGLTLILALAVTGPALGDPRSELLFHRGIAAYGAGDYADAKSAFDAYLERSPGDADALRFLGMIARQAGDTEGAIARFNEAIAAAPDDVEARVALVETLLDAGRNQEALEAAEQAIAKTPDDGRLQLYTGIAAYRLGAPGAALDHFDRAARLDPELAREARYYTGLAQAVLGNLYASAGALGDVVEGSPGHPLGVSAQNLRQQMIPNIPDRIWYLGAAVGLELDTNPTGTTDLLPTSTDFAGTFRLRGLVDAYRGHGLTLRGGYEGFLSLYARDSFVNQQSHIFKGLALYDYKDLRFSLRYDYALTLLDLTQKFRSVHLVEPTVSFRAGRFGITQAFYAFERFEYFSQLAVPALDRNGNKHSVGVNQIFILDEPLNYARVGLLYTNRDTTGSEFAYGGFEVNAGGGLVLPWRDISFSALYRFGRNSYDNPSIFPARAGTQPPAPGQGIKRTENIHNVSFDVSAPVWRQLTVAFAATLTWASSDVDVYDYNRQIAGIYFTWDF